ncbi:Non-reducing polyketide synthase mapC [Lachnellula cervina]|uniref:Non-reducing polyketide synthase mapC n=1 Tax=Lachnellula cervina TaxID=1316786 RepID=A0A7D8YZP3_9HELO|nr:Non-reducing polyketide synthase mapC [Lachnellula cervina]
MASREILVFKSTDNLDLKLDIYTRESWSQIKVWDERQPVVVFFHGGGYVGYDREHLPPHIVQSCLLRGWPLISPDYRKLPQVTGEVILSDAEAAYDYVVENALRILTRGESNQAMKNIIVVGASAGGHMALLCGHYMEPRPIAILEYYAVPTVQDDFFRTGKVLGPAPLELSDVEEFLSEAPSLGHTPAYAAFNQCSLLLDLSHNPDFKPSVWEPNPRMKLFPWLVQGNRFPELWAGVDKGFNDKSWKDFPPVIVVQGSDDGTVPLEASLNLTGITSATLFVVNGKDHAFDEPLYLGDPDLQKVEAAWSVLERTVKRTIAANVRS